MLTRNITNKINWILDNVVPPILRDSKWFMKLLFYPLFKDKSVFFLEFKEKLPQITATELQKYYRILQDVHIDRNTDLSNSSIEYIINNIKGNKILDIACGKGFLADKMAEVSNLDVTGADFILTDKLFNSNNKVKYEMQNIEQTTYANNIFDTVISAHTLEHTLDINKAIKELKRITKQRLIIVVPRQREYKYTFDLHTYFFPYKWKIEKIMDGKNYKSFYLDNDIVYVEDFS